MAKVGEEKEVSKEVWDKIKKQVESLKFGTVTITVHDGRITQVETNSKLRF